jgi:quercetin dioxygenase-like cupin family protein
MPISLAFAALLTFGLQTAPVPGGCSEPANENVGRPGCFLSAEFTIADPPAALFWHVLEFQSAAEAQSATETLPWARAVSAHGRHWMLALDASNVPKGVASRAVIGPLALPRGPVSVRFMESLFPAGMATRVHTHPGPEAFFVVEGEQCVDSAAGWMRIGPGESFVVAGGPHLQAAPLGRRSLVVLITPVGEPWMRLEQTWPATGRCVH